MFHTQFDPTQTPYFSGNRQEGAYNSFSDKIPIEGIKRLKRAFKRVIGYKVFLLDSHFLHLD